VVDPKVDDSLRVSWIAYEAGAYGQVPKIGDKWVCYFSDSDVKSTCGPNPFRVSNIGFSPYTFEVNTTDYSGNTGGKALGVFIGGIKLDSRITTDIDNKMVYISVWPVPGGGVTEISYVTYYANNLSVVPNKNGNLEYDPQLSMYRENLTLDLGEYYIAFSAPAGSDYGGAVARVDMSLTGNGNGVTGYVDVDPVSLNILINKNQRYEKSNFRITNLMNRNLTDMTVRIPTTEPVDVNDFLSIVLSNTTLDSRSSMYFSVVLEHVVNSMEIKTQAQLKSNNSLIGYISIDITVSVKNESGTAMVSCEGKSDMTYCYGGICCDEVCRVKSDCCEDSDCASDEECESYKCVKTEPVDGNIPCTTGTCYTDYTSCPSGESYTGTCKVSGVDGICCEVTVNECLGQPDLTKCNFDSGVCCSEVCVDGDCCSDSNCPLGDLCVYNSTWDAYYCTPPEAPAFDLTIPIIIVVIIAAGAGAWFYLKKRKKGPDEEFEEGGEEFEEEFY